MNVTNIELSKELYELSGIEWRPVVGLENRYLVSEQGEVRSLPSRTGKGKIRKVWQNGEGYCYVSYIDSEGRLKKLAVHRAVAEAFHPNPDSKPHVNHIDNNPRNNAASNLEWATPAENVAHAHRFGNGNHGMTQGELHGMHKLTETQVINIMHVKGAISGLKLAKLYSVGSQAIYNIWNGTGWKHITQGVLTRGGDE